jgi:hypothetical protein
MPLPSQLFAGDSASWTDESVPADATAATVYMRGNGADAAIAIEGALAGGKWGFALSSEDSTALPPGLYGVQFTAITPAGQATYRPLARIEILQGLGFTSEPSPLDPRTPSEIELAELRVAIRAIYRSASYTIGTATGSRTLRRADLPWLEARERTLLRRIATESSAARGISRRVLVHFPGN